MIEFTQLDHQTLALFTRSFKVGLFEITTFSQWKDFVKT